MNRFLMLVFGICVAAVVGYAVIQRPDSGVTRLNITGSSTIAPLLSEIARRYESLNPHVHIDVQTGGSSRGMADVRQGLADMGMVSRSPREDERDLAWHVIANDGICLIVHRDNPVGALSDQQVEDIYTKRITRWSELGARDAPIVVVNKAQGRSTLEVFLEHYALGAGQVQADVIIGDNQQGLKTVAGNVDAIGYVSVGAAQFEEQRGGAIRALPSKGIAATRESVRTGEYPVMRKLHVVTPGDVSEPISAFVAFSQSPEVEDLIESQFFIPPGS